jgi:opacity protein-like surface antigen
VAPAQVGAMYAFAPHWFLDVNYTFARSSNFTIVNPVFVHTQIGPLTLSGPAVLNAQEHVTNQSVTLTLNYRFH